MKSDYDDVNGMISAEQRTAIVGSIARGLMWAGGTRLVKHGYDAKAVSDQTVAMASYLFAAVVVLAAVVWSWAKNRFSSTQKVQLRLNPTASRYSSTPGGSVPGLLLVIGLAGVLFVGPGCQLLGGDASFYTGVKATYPPVSQTYRRYVQTDTTITPDEKQRFLDSDQLMQDLITKEGERRGAAVPTTQPAPPG
jgi:hypothetical protein